MLINTMQNTFTLPLLILLYCELQLIL